MKWQEFRNLIHDEVRLPEPADAGFSARAKEWLVLEDSHPAPRSGRRLGTALGSFLMVFSLGLMVFLGTQTKATVSLDINPSLSLEINHFDQVIGIEADNEAGQQLLDSLDSRSGSISDIVSEILCEAETQHYLSADSESFLLFGVSGQNYRVEQRIQELVDQTVAEDNVELLFMNRHSETDEGLYSGIAAPAKSFWDGIGLGNDQESSLTTVLTVPALPDFSAVDGTGNYGDEAEWKSEWQTGDLFLKDLSEAEFLALAESYQVSPAKLQLAIRVFEGYGNYLFESDLKNLCALSVEELIRLYSALE